MLALWILHVVITLSVVLKNAYLSDIAANSCKGDNVEI